MADIKTAIDFVLRQEDSTLAGTITSAPADRGGTTRFGLTQRWHPELVLTGFFAFTTVAGKQTPKMPAGEALALAERTYEAVYGPQLAISQITNQALATALLSFAVLEGTREAVTILQRAVVASGAPIAVDGNMGPATIRALNAADPAKLVGLVVQFQRRYFAQIAKNVPSQVKWIDGWNNRADAILALATPPTAKPAAAAV